MPFHIVLVEPEIPANTGNISRTCAATGATLHLVHPLGFSTDNRALKRAGLDYWPAVKVRHHQSFAELQQEYPDGRFFYATTKAKRSYHEMAYQSDDFLVFGKETSGLPEALLVANPDGLIRLPMTGDVRSMNLSNAVAVVLFEALRQHDFFDLE